MSYNSALARTDRRHRPLTSEEQAKRALVAAMFREKDVTRGRITEAIQSTDIPPAETPPAQEHHGDAATGVVDAPTPDADPSRPRGDCDTETVPEIGNPPPDLWIARSDGVTRWRAIVDDIRVTPLPGGGCQLDGTALRTTRLDAQMRAHLALLIMPDAWRTALVNAGAL